MSMISDYVSLQRSHLQNTYAGPFDSHSTYLYLHLVINASVAKWLCYRHLWKEIVNACITCHIWHYGECNWQNRNIYWVKRAAKPEVRCHLRIDIKFAWRARSFIISISEYDLCMYVFKNISHQQTLIVHC